MMYITGDGTANISYSFVKQIPTNPFLFDLFGDEIRVMPDAYLDVDDDKRSPATYVLQFRYLFFYRGGCNVFCFDDYCSKCRCAL